jgi:glycosyltransferase involved in cell wall biosynthesis
MKVAFLIHSMEVSGCRYRVLQYLPYLKEHGVDGSVHFYKRTWREKMGFYRTLTGYDILYLHRRLLSPLEFWLLRRNAKKIVYDFDDAVMYRSSRSKRSRSADRRLKFAFMMKKIDFAVAGNEFLRSEALRYNPNVAVVPTSIDLSRYQTKQGARIEGPVTIGWVGSSSTLMYLERLLPTLEKVFQKSPNVRLKIVCDRFLDSPILPIVKKPWSSGEELDDLKSFDIGIMPLSDDLWSRGKCGFKILQYYGAGIPVVCTPVGVNRDIVRDGVNGFWAAGEGEWEDRLQKLIDSETLRRKMGLQGRKTVEQAYCFEVNAPRVLEVLRKVAGEEAGP